MKSITALASKAKCLELMAAVAATGEPRIITKHGQPMHQLFPRSPQALDALRDAAGQDQDHRRPHRAARGGVGSALVILWDTHTLICLAEGHPQLVQRLEAWRRVLLDRGLREWPLIASSPPQRCCTEPRRSRPTIVSSRGRVRCSGTMRANERGHDMGHSWLPDEGFDG